MFAGKPMMIRRTATRVSRFAALGSAFLAAVAAGSVAAAPTDGLTDLAQVPLISVSPQTVKPNMLFILDDSGSMAWSHMPDAVDDFAWDGNGNRKFGYVSSQCNGVYYNPALTYTPPVQVAADGTITTMANSSFNAAWINGYNQSAGTVNLGTSFRAWSSVTGNDTVANSGLSGTSDTAQAAFYYRYTGTQTADSQRQYLNTASTFYTECNTLTSSTTAPFTRVTVSSNSGVGGTDERTNFANWYSYYRTRMLTMKSSTGRAFRGIDNRYRIGFMSINGSSTFQNIGDYGATQKSTWYSKLYGAVPGGGTPLREALANAGLVFANKKATIDGVSVTDPVQYSCQKNFALLSTDGYWNGNNGVQVDGTTAIGNNDSDDPRPFNDGGSVANVYRATITVNAVNGADNISSIRVNGIQILAATATSSGFSGGRSNNLASNVTTQIQACRTAVSGNCGTFGYTATRSSNVVTITAPASAGNLAGITPAVTANGQATFTATSFAASPVTTGGTSDTLADVAAYYYSTDLRTTALGNQAGALGSTYLVDTNNVLPSGDDDATWQHMTTFTLGLGAPGRMTYSASYRSDTTGHFAAIKNGSTATGSSGPCPWQSSGTCTWPTPGANLPENIDDLWHAAVNGRGIYFSARDPSALAVGLVGALQGITAMTSDAAAASTSNPNITAGDNYLFSSTFRTAEWYGELDRRQINVSTGALSATPDWTAADQLDAKSSRTIWTFDDSTSSTTKLKPFTWDDLTSSERNYFTSNYIGSTATPPLSQFCSSGEICLSSASQSAAGGSPLINFLRGERTNEGPANDTSKYFRQRTHILGDIVNSEAVFVKTPQFDYVDAGYSQFKLDQASRLPTVYVGANDGMLHAFDAATGEERWAYVPKLLYPTLYRLADKYYATNHQYYVDGSPTVGDVYINGAWRTILVGGFNAGGRGYYALDITNPTSPKALWEFTDANMGMSYGRPEITKLANGTWVVLLTSGYNNVNPGDGKGYLYVVNAGTGANVFSPIGTGVGSDTGTVAGACTTAPCPSGLAQIRAYVDNTRYDNTAVKVYGGDLFGNLWRFDVNNTIGVAGRDAQLLATLRGPTNLPQSITARPELGLVEGQTVIYVGTGRYLGTADLTNTDVQSIYAIKDVGGTTSWGNPRADQTATGFVKQTLTNGTCPDGAVFCTPGSPIRTGSTTTAANLTVQKGWFVDLPANAERANTDPQLALGTLAITTNVLDPSACSVGGRSYINYFDYRTGLPVTGADGLVSVLLDSALATRAVQIRLQSGSGGSDSSGTGTVRSVVRLTNNTTLTTPTPISPNPMSTRRTSWRVLISD